MRLVPKNWSDFQHYKDRSPPWVRLHRKLLDDKEFHRLPVASRALAPMLWLLASESMTGEFDGDPDELAFRLRSTEKEMAAALKPLIDKGFFVVVRDASAALAHCGQVAVPEAEAEAEADTETETEQRQKAPTVLVGRKAPNPEPYKVPDCPYEEILAAFHDSCGVLPRVTVLNDARRDHMRTRWREVCKADAMEAAEALEWFVWFFQRVSRSRFLTGRSPPRQGKRSFSATFDWLMLPTNFAKVVDGNYDDKEAA